MGSSSRRAFLDPEGGPKILKLRARNLLPALILLVLAAPAANATHFCHPPAVVFSTGLVYVEIDEILGRDGYVYSIWIYVESNGRSDLQRGGSNLLGEPDVCQNDADPDTAIF